MTRTWSIYVLCDPRNHEIRYVGYTVYRPEVRLQQHIDELHKEQTKYTFKYRWIAKLDRMGLQPYVTVVQQFTSPVHARGAEIYWISYFRSIGCRLTNHRDGGQGGSFPQSPQKMEAMRRVGDKNRGRKRTAASKELMRQAALARSAREREVGMKHPGGRQHGFKQSEETREKMRQAALLRYNKIYDDDLIYQMHLDGQPAYAIRKKIGCSPNYLARCIERKSNEYQIEYYI